MDVLMAIGMWVMKAEEVVVDRDSDLHNELIARHNGHLITSRLVWWTSGSCRKASVKLKHKGACHNHPYAQ